MGWWLINGKFFPAVLEAGIYGVAHVLVLRQEALGVSSVIRALIPCRGLRPCDLIISQRPHLQTITREIGFNIGDFRRHKYSLYSTSRACISQMKKPSLAEERWLSWDGRVYGRARSSAIPGPQGLVSAGSREPALWAGPCLLGELMHKTPACKCCSPVRG